MFLPLCQWYLNPITLHSFNKLIIFDQNSFAWLKRPLFLYNNIYTHINYFRLNTNYVLFQALDLGRLIFVECSKNPTLEPNLHTFTSKWSFPQPCILNYKLLWCYIFWISTILSVSVLNILSRPNFLCVLLTSLQLVLSLVLLVSCFPLFHSSWHLLGMVSNIVLYSLSSNFVILPSRHVL
jgi:hypothetical protein